MTTPLVNTWKQHHVVTWCWHDTLGFGQNPTVLPQSFVQILDYHVSDILSLPGIHYKWHNVCRCKVISPVPTPPSSSGWLLLDSWQAYQGYFAVHCANLLLLKAVAQNQRMVTHASCSEESKLCDLTFTFQNNICIFKYFISLVFHKHCFDYSTLLQFSKYCIPLD